jgi:hypothetical protein
MIFLNKVREGSKSFFKLLKILRKTSIKEAATPKDSKTKKLLAELIAIPFVGLTTPSERGHSPDGLIRTTNSPHLS